MIMADTKWSVVVTTYGVGHIIWRILLRYNFMYLVIIINSIYFNFPTIINEFVIIGGLIIKVSASRL